MKLNKRSIDNLTGVHPDLVAVVKRAAKSADFYVTEGLRTQERQIALVKAGKSQTKNSRHLYGFAVDLCDCDGCYDVPDMQGIATAMKDAAAALKIPLVWGGDWKTFKDTPHFELCRKSYPDTGYAKPFVLKPGTPTRVAAGSGAAVAVTEGIPNVPAPPVELVSGLTDWQSAAEAITSFATSKHALVAVLAIGLFGWALPWAAQKWGKTWQGS